MIKHRLDGSFCIEEILRDIRNNSFFSNMHGDFMFEDWKDNERNIYNSLILADLPIFQTIDLLKDRCQIKTHQKLKQAGFEAMLANKILVYDIAPLPNISIKYNILFNKDFIEFALSYKCDKSNIIESIYDVILHFGIETIVNHQIDRINKVYNKK